MPENCYRFELPPLPYDYGALEPYINTQTMRVHHDRLQEAYVNKLNTALEDCPQLWGWNLERMLENPCALPVSMRTPVIRFGGGVWNHTFFFRALRPGTGDNRPEGGLGRAIGCKFGSLEAFRAKFKEEAMAVFGSGWMWLVKDCRGELLLEHTANQDSPLTLGHTPLIVVDLWEHAYFLQYLNLRDQYLDSWFSIINWSRAEALYCGARG